MPPEAQNTSDSDFDVSLPSQGQGTISRRNSCGPKYFCSIEGCSDSFKRLDHLDRHEYKHTGIKKHTCSYEDCDKVYTILTHLKRHIRTTHERDAPLAKTICCEIDDCDKMFTSESNMHRHIREVHENPKVYHCPHCNDKFTQKLKMRRHEITSHTGEYPFHCGKCSRGFFQQWQYERHESSCKVYLCHNCDQIFDKWTVYLKHCKEQQHGRKYYKCEHCSRVYGKPGELQKHVAAKHMDGEEKMVFKCLQEGCGRFYSYERNLRQHMRTAHNGQRFPCAEVACGKDFSSLQNLSKHMRRDHSIPSEIDRGVPAESKKKHKAKRKKRKDAGKTQMSQLSRLTGLLVDRNVDKLLRERKPEAIIDVSKTLELLAENEVVTDSSVADEDLPEPIIDPKRQQDDSVTLDSFIEMAFQD